MDGRMDRCTEACIAWRQSAAPVREGACLTMARPRPLGKDGDTTHSSQPAEEKKNLSG